MTTPKLTDLEARLLKQLALCEYNPNNGAEPQERHDVNTYVWADERARALGISVMSVKGAFGSLVKKGLIWLMDDEDNFCGFTEAGFEAYKQLSEPDIDEQIRDLVNELPAPLKKVAKAARSIATRTDEQLKERLMVAIEEKGGKRFDSDALVLNVLGLKRGNDAHDVALTIYHTLRGDRYAIRSWSNNPNVTELQQAAAAATSKVVREAHLRLTEAMCRLEASSNMLRSYGSNGRCYNIWYTDEQLQKRAEKLQKSRERSRERSRARDEQAEALVAMLASEGIEGAKVDVSGMVTLDADAVRDLLELLQG